MTAKKTGMPDNGRNGWIDLARVIATILVICIHCGTPYFISASPAVSSSDRFFACLVASIARICIPLFFLISGFLLLKPDLDPEPFYRKRFRRLLIPWAFWSVIYLLVRIFLQKNRISVLSALRLIYTGHVFYHLWFLYALAGLYLALPFLAPLTEAGKTNRLCWFAGLAMLLGSVLPAFAQLAQFLTGYPFYCGVDKAIFSVYAGYAALGVLCGRLPLTASIKYSCWIILIGGFGLTIGLSWWDFKAHGVATEKWFGFDQPAIAAASIACFFLLRQAAIPFRFLPALKAAAGLTFGIYLCHPLIIELLRTSGWSPPASAFIGIPLCSGIVLLGSAVIVFLLSKLPVIRSVAGQG